MQLKAEKPTPTLLQKAVGKTRKDALFVWIPKCAGTSVCNILVKNGGQKRANNPTEQFENKGLATFGHARIPTLLSLNVISQSYFKKAFKFAFVRNPFERTVSLYRFLKDFGIPEIPFFMSFPGFCRKLERGDIPPVGLYKRKGLSQANPMLDWLKDDKGEVFVDFIGRYENITEDFGKVCKILGINETLPHDNATQHRHYREYYTPQSRAIVEKLYRQDLDYFGYCF